MKKSGLLLIIPFLIPDFMFAQLASDYNPLQVGNFWIQHTDTSFGGYQPTTFRTDIEDIDLIGGEEYFRMRQGLTVDDGSSESHWYLWIREDATGGVIGAFGDTSIVDSATIYDPPLPSFPDEAVNLGYSWEYDFPGTGIGNQHWDSVVESVSETVQVPAGTFKNCIKIRIILTDTLDNIIQTGDLYYAEGIGQVLNVGWSIFQNSFEFELIKYFVQAPVGVKEIPSLPIHFNLRQNYPNPFNPETEIRFALPSAGHVVLRVFNALGQTIRTLVDDNYEPGVYDIHWDTRNNYGKVVGSGIYFYQLKVGEFSQTRKMALLR